jgi:uncharacterized integral membrane protein
VSTPQPPEPSDQPPPAPPVEEPAAAPPPPPAEKEDKPSTWQPLLYTKIALLLFVIAYSIAFVVQNTHQINVDFVFWTAKVRLIWEILLLLAIGLIGGVLLSQLYRHRRRAQLAKHGRKAGDAGADLGRRDKAVGKSR